MTLPKVKIIKLGTCILEASEITSPTTWEIKYALGVGGGSNVILIETDRKILVDIGFEFESLVLPANVERNREELIKALRKYGYEPDDIDAVFITHWHLDHYGSIDLFNKAEHMASKILVESMKLRGFTPVDDGQEIGNNVNVLFTPGHTLGHASVLVNSGIRVKSSSSYLRYRIAIAGDAIVSLSYFDQGKLWSYNQDFYSKEEGLKSMRMLADHSDLIIPGHGVPFITYKPKWMSEES